MHPLHRFVVLSFALILSAGRLCEAKVAGVPVPKQFQSTRFRVLVNEKPVDVMHAAARYDFVSIDSTEPIRLSITSKEPDFWDHGVDVQPWRLGLRPSRSGSTIELRLKDPAKICISQPGDFLNHATMLFIFFSRPPAPPPGGAQVHIVPAGIERSGLNPKSGDTYYLQPGAVITGSLNLWKVHDVKVLGRGVIVYDGPQNPKDDDGWMQKPDWHCIGALEARHIEVSGVTCVVRSRTWSIQMKDSNDFVYNDLRVIGGNPGNANQDGMDWLGGGNTVVRDSFFRASDDVFAIQGNWDGYGHDAMVAPGHDVQNVLVENSVLSTSISNIVRAGWPEKSFNSHNFTLRNSDILHGGIGSCGPPFALFTFWGANGASGNHSGYTFENLWLDDWYSLMQIEQEQPGLHGFTFRNIWGLGQPPLVASKLEGPIKDVHIQNVKYGQANVTSDINLPVSVEAGASEPSYAGADRRVRAAFHVTPAVIEPGTKVEFIADGTADPHARYTWFFGDGTSAVGRHVRHKYPDAKGTELDGPGGDNGSFQGSERTRNAGSFRVMLHVEAKQGLQDWAEQEVTVVSRLDDVVAAAADTEIPTAPGLDYHVYPGTWPSMPSFTTETPIRHGTAARLVDASAGGFTRFAMVYDGFLNVPEDGGYNFHLLERDGARLLIDGQLVTETGPPFAEVCGSPMNAVRYANGVIGLHKGKHVVRIEALESVSPGSPRLLWDGPGLGLQDVPAAAFSHLNIASSPARSVAAVAPPAIVRAKHRLFRKSRKSHSQVKATGL